MLPSVRDDGSYTDDEMATIYGVAGGDIPSFLAEDYQPLPPGTSRPAWLFGVIGLLIPIVSLFGMVNGLRVAHGGNRLGWAAAVWCLATAGASTAYWWTVTTATG